MSQTCALSTEQLWHRYQPCALREKVLLGKRKSMLLCLHYSCDQNYLFFKKPLYAANNSLLPVQTRGARNKRLSSRLGIEESEMKAPVQMGLHMICTAMETEGAARSCLSPAA